MEEFLGKTYVLQSSENFEDYLVYLGKGYIARKAALALSPEQRLTINHDGSYTLSFNSVLVSADTVFRPGEEFDEIRPDGVTVKSIITIEDNKLIQIHTDEKGRISTHVRDFFSDYMTMTTTAEGLNKTVKRHFVLVK